MLLAVIDQVVPLPVSKTVAILHRDNGDDFAPALDVFLGHVGKAHMANLTLLAQLGQCFHGGIVGDGRVGNMKLVNIDAIQAQALETAFHCCGKVLGAGIVNPLRGPTTLPPALGGHHYSCRIRVEGLSDQLFGDVRAVGVRGIDEVDAQFHGTAQSGERRGLVFGRAPDSFAGNAHGSIAQAVDSEVATQSDGSGGCSSNGLGLAHGHAPILVDASSGTTGPAVFP